MRVAILGCGPAGLLAAHAAVERGHQATIFSLLAKSPIPGAQYVHEPIPGITREEPDGMLTYLKMGTREGYAEKLYGDRDAPVSWDRFKEGEHPAWSMEFAYERLWQLYVERTYEAIELFDVRIDADDIDRMANNKFAVVLSSIPAKALCYNTEHRFQGQRVFIANHPVVYSPELIIYSGRPRDSWYRSSTIFGHTSTEWPESRKPESIHGWRGEKPISTDCDCHLEHASFFRIGRFGQWEKQVLVSDAYHRAHAVMREIEA